MFIVVCICLDPGYGYGLCENECAEIRSAHFEIPVYCIGVKWSRVVGWSDEDVMSWRALPDSFCQWFEEPLDREGSKVSRDSTFEIEIGTGDFEHSAGMGCRFVRL